MWNSDNPLKIYLTMTEDYTYADLERLQKVIDEDKALDSRRNNRDVCGEYAPFCEYCDKSLTYPCARAYIKMKQAEVIEPIKPEQPVAETPTLEQIVEVEEEKTDKDIVTEVAVEEPLAHEDGTPKKIIRIARIKRVK